MTDLVTVAELRDFLDDQALDLGRSRLFLDIAEGEVIGYTGNTFAWTEGDTIRLNGTGSTVLLLPEAPVGAVYDLVEAASTETPTTLGAVDDGGSSWEWDEDGVIERVDGAVFARRRRWYQVTYDHGFTTLPDDVRGVILRAAASAFDNPEGTLQQETLGAYSYTAAGASAGIGLSAPDRMILDRYFVSSKMRDGKATTGSGGS